MAWQEFKWLIPLIAVFVPWGLLLRLAKKDTKRPPKDVI